MVRELQESVSQLFHEYLTIFGNIRDIRNTTGKFGEVHGRSMNFKKLQESYRCSNHDVQKASKIFEVSRTSR